MPSEFSAGGVVMNDANEVVVIVPTRRAADGSRVLALPKGHPDGAESSAEAALREVREEAGVQGELVEKLGDVRYWYRRHGKRVQKTVHFYLCEFQAGDTADHDHEVDDARWIPLRDAERLLTYPAERRLAELAQSKIRGDR